LKQRQQQLKKLTNVVRAQVGALVCAIALTAGCSESPKPPAAPPPAQAKQQPKTAPTGTAAALAEAAKEVYTYNPAGRRDPFAPIIIKAEIKAKTSNRPPLERYNINEFKFTGIVWGGFGYNAMLEGPDGKGYFVRKGTVIGPNQGVVKKITSNSLAIEEKYKTATGETERREIIVELRKKQEGIP